MVLFTPGMHCLYYFYNIIHISMLLSLIEKRVNETHSELKSETFIQRAFMARLIRCTSNSMILSSPVLVLAAWRIFQMCCVSSSATSSRSPSIMSSSSCAFAISERSSRGGLHDEGGVVRSVRVIRGDLRECLRGDSRMDTAEEGVKAPLSTQTGSIVQSIVHEYIPNKLLVIELFNFVTQDQLLLKLIQLLSSDSLYISVLAKISITSMQCETEREPWPRNSCGFFATHLLRLK